MQTVDDEEDGEDGDDEEDTKAADVELQAETLRMLAARFCQAVAELQNMGFIRPGKSRLGHTVQRIAFQPGAF